MIQSRSPTSARSSGSVVITGGAGFIGRALSWSFARRDVPVVRVDCRHADDGFEGLERSFEDLAGGASLGLLAEARAVVHLAGRVGVRNVVREPAVVADANKSLAGQLLRVLSLLPRSERPRIFAASTSEVYLPKRTPLSERDPTRGVAESGRWAYAASKVACERMFDEAHSGARGPVHMRFFNVVGPGQDSTQGMMLPTFVEHALAGLPLPVHGDGSSVRMLAHVDDVAETIAELVLRDDVPAGPLNIGGTASASVLEIAHAVIAHSGRRSAIIHVDPRQVVGEAFEDVLWREPDLTRLRSLGVPVPTRSLEAIVQDTLARHAHQSRRRVACASRAS